MLGLFSEVSHGNHAAIQIVPELVALDPVQFRIEEYEALSSNEDLYYNSYDRIRFYQGLLLYLSGYVSEAKLKLQEISVQPSGPKNGWAEFADFIINSPEILGSFLDDCRASGGCGQYFGFDTSLTSYRSVNFLGLSIFFAKQDF